MPKEAKRVGDVSTSLIRKMFDIVIDAKKKGIDVVSLSIGEPDFDTDERIIELACNAKREGYTHYTPNMGLEELRYAIAEKYGVELTEVMVTAGASEALFNASMSFIERNSEVIIPSPNFLSYFVYAKLCEGKTIQIKTHPEFKLDIDRISELMNKNISLIFLNYPNNPTGVVESQRNLKAIVELAQDYDAIVVSDEIYDTIYYGEKPTSLAGEENVITVNGFSKSLAMTGWRIGFTIASQEILDSMLKIHQVNGVCAPAFAQKAVADAIEAGIFDSVASKMRGAFRERRDYIYTAFRKLGFEITKPEGAFYIFPKIPEGWENCMEFTEKLVMSGVAVTPGKPFGDWNDKYIRVSYAASLDRLRLAVNRIEEFLNNF